MTKAGILALLMAVLWTPTLAADETKGTARVIYVGFGASRCDEFRDKCMRFGNEIENAYFDWAQGFISGVNEVISKKGNIIDVEIQSLEWQKAYIRNYCESKPNELYAHAVRSLIDRLCAYKGIRGCLALSNSK